MKNLQKYLLLSFIIFLFGCSAAQIQTQQERTWANQLEQYNKLQEQILAGADLFDDTEKILIKAIDSQVNYLIDSVRSGFESIDQAIIQMDLYLRQMKEIVKELELRKL